MLHGVDVIVVVDDDKLGGSGIVAYAIENDLEQSTVDLFHIIRWVVSSHKNPMLDISSVVYESRKA